MSADGNLKKESQEIISMNKTPSSKEDLLMTSLSKFFFNKKHLQKMRKITDGKSGISLRLLDWFVTNYSKKYNITLDLKTRDDTIQKFNVYLDYKSQLKAYSKKQFDPFCRRRRISFMDHDENEIETTVGQLNFFRWALENGIVGYVEDNLEEIEGDMDEALRDLYKKSTADTVDTVDAKDTEQEESREEQKKRKKRHELSLSATKTVNKHDVKIIVKFD